MVKKQFSVGLPVPQLTMVVSSVAFLNQLFKFLGLFSPKLVPKVKSNINSVELRFIHN